jgi:hypothetical protein
MEIMRTGCETATRKGRRKAIGDVKPLALPKQKAAAHEEEPP